MDIFAQATRVKLTFDTPNGIIDVSDLWDLPLTSAKGRASLDDLAVTLHKQIENSGTPVSFVEPSKKADPKVKLRFDCVKFVLDTKIAERKAAADDRAAAETLQTLLAAKAKKRQGNVEGMTEAELDAAIASIRNRSSATEASAN